MGILSHSKTITQFTEQTNYFCKILHSSENSFTAACYHRRQIDERAIGDREFWPNFDVNCDMPTSDCEAIDDVIIKIMFGYDIICYDFAVKFKLPRVVFKSNMAAKYGPGRFLWTKLKPKLEYHSNIDTCVPYIPGFFISIYSKTDRAITKIHIWFKLCDVWSSGGTCILQTSFIWTNRQTERQMNEHVCKNWKFWQVTNRQTYKPTTNEYTCQDDNFGKKWLRVASSPESSVSDKKLVGPIYS